MQQFEKSSNCCGSSALTDRKPCEPSAHRHWREREIQSHFYQMEEMLPESASLTQSLFFSFSAVIPVITSQLNFTAVGETRLVSETVSATISRKHPIREFLVVEWCQICPVKHRTLTYAKTLWSCEAIVKLQCFILAVALRKDLHVPQVWAKMGHFKSVSSRMHVYSQS